MKKLFPPLAALLIVLTSCISVTNPQNVQKNRHPYIRSVTLTMWNVQLMMMHHFISKGGIDDVRKAA